MLFLLWSHLQKAFATNVCLAALCLVDLGIVEEANGALSIGYALARLTSKQSSG